MTLRHTKTRHTFHLRTNKQIHSSYSLRFLKRHVVKQHDKQAVATPEQHLAPVSSRNIMQDGKFKTQLYSKDKAKFKLNRQSLSLLMWAFLIKMQDYTVIHVLKWSEKDGTRNEQEGEKKFNTSSSPLSIDGDERITPHKR